MTTIETPETANFGSIIDAIPLEKLSLGLSCRVVAVDESSESLLRLMEMGLIPGAHVVLERAAPLGSPYTVRIGGCTLAVRAVDARRIFVCPITEAEVVSPS